MTNMEYVKHLLEEATQRHGENAFSTRMLSGNDYNQCGCGKRRSRSCLTDSTWERGRDRPARTTRSTGGTPGELTDLTGDPVLSPEERAEAEAEEERRPENANRARRSGSSVSMVIGTAPAATFGYRRTPKPLSMMPAAAPQ